MSAHQVFVSLLNSPEFSFPPVGHYNILLDTQMNETPNGTLHHFLSNSLLSPLQKKKVGGREKKETHTDATTTHKRAN